MGLPLYHGRHPGRSSPPVPIHGTSYEDFDGDIIVVQNLRFLFRCVSCRPSRVLSSARFLSALCCGSSKADWASVADGSLEVSLLRSDGFFEWLWTWRSSACAPNTPAMSSSCPELPSLFPGECRRLDSARGVALSCIPPLETSLFWMPPMAPSLCFALLAGEVEDGGPEGSLEPGSACLILGSS